MRQMRYFVAVAEELHFTRAAQRLHMSQQPLSTAIARLEAQLGVRLFERTTRRVELTQAGVAYLEAARSALRAADAATDVAQRAAKGELGEVSVGVAAAAWYGLGELFAELQARHPGLRLNVRQQSSRPLVDAVLAGELDLVIGLCVPPAPDIDLVRLKDEPVVLVLPSEHRLAAESAVDLAAFRNETFALDEPEEGPGYNAAVLALCQRAGFAPVTRTVQTHHDAWERLIAEGGAIGLTTQCSLHASHPGTRSLSVDPPATFALDLVTRAGSELSATVRTVIAVARDTAQRHGWVA